MQPPICEVCQSDGRTGDDEFGLVQFADFEPLPEDIVGHPPGLGWFCGEHTQQAESLAHLSLAEAVRQIREA